MTIRIQKVSDDLYTAKVIMPDMPAVKSEWSTEEPLTGHQLCKALIELGCHQTDIGDALYQQDANWVQKLRDPGYHRHE
ncbi:MAG TPA: hypothetical protein VJU82_09825 [Acidobacteriaceae bacterium]|nr:hypothetical protein [Acidobacteriaceae bacterium]